MSALIERITTRDGASIACKRRPAAGPPVIFVHGIAVNADIWDIPEIHGADFVFRSLSSMLAECGCDIWLMNLRGHGAPHMHSAPPAGQTDWCVDHFILQDLPAVVEHVNRVTGRPAALIGSSMGSMTIAAYLQGAVSVGYGALQTIIADEAAARHRAKLVCGAVYMEMPAALRWPDSLYDDRGALRWAELLRGWKRTDPRQNFPFEWLARAGWVHLALDALGEIRLDWLRPGDRDGVEAPAVVRSAESLRSFSQNVKRQAMQWFSTNFKGAREFCPETFLDGVLYAADHMKAGVLRQMAKSVRARAFISAMGSPDHVYSDFYDAIESPALVIAGGCDRIANPDVIRGVFFDRIGSRDKTLRIFDQISHGEFEYSPAASREVYPVIADWIQARHT